MRETQGEKVSEKQYGLNLCSSALDNDRTLSAAASLLQVCGGKRFWGLSRTMESHRKDWSHSAIKSCWCRYRNVRPHSLPAGSHSFVGMAKETAAMPPATVVKNTTFPPTVIEADQDPLVEENCLQRPTFHFHDCLRFGATCVLKSESWVQPPPLYGTFCGIHP